jgi:hypothetical protein
VTDAARTGKSRLAAVAALTIGAITLLGAVLVGMGWWKGSQSVSRTEPMELAGSWLGMRLTSPDSASARQLGVPAKIQGVVVAEIVPGFDSRAANAGLLPGDVLVRIDGQEVGGLSELYSLTTKLDVIRPLMVEILRRGQPRAVVIPAPPELPLGQTGSYGRLGTGQF